MTCTDCGKVLSNYRATRCRSCASTRRNIGRKHTEETKRKISEAGIKRYDKIGRNDHNNRKYNDYKIWRKSVLEHDSYTCQHCGKKENLRVHHIEDYENNPELRTELSNGITLCKWCHANFHHLYGKQSTRGKVLHFLRNIKI